MILQGLSCNILFVLVGCHLFYFLFFQTPASFQNLPGLSHTLSHATRDPLLCHHHPPPPRLCYSLGQLSAFHLSDHRPSPHWGGPRFSGPSARPWPEHCAPKRLLCQPLWAQTRVAWYFVEPTVGFLCTEGTSLWGWRRRCYCCTGEAYGLHRSVTWFHGHFITIRQFFLLLHESMWCLFDTSTGIMHDLYGSDTLK